MQNERPHSIERNACEDYRPIEVIFAHWNGFNIRVNRIKFWINKPAHSSFSNTPCIESTRGFSERKSVFCCSAFPLCLQSLHDRPLNPAKMCSTRDQALALATFGWRWQVLAGLGWHWLVLATLGELGWSFLSLISLSFPSLALTQFTVRHLRSNMSISYDECTHANALNIVTQA